MSETFYKACDVALNLKFAGPTKKVNPRNLSMDQVQEIQRLTRDTTMTYRRIADAVGVKSTFPVDRYSQRPRVVALALQAARRRLNNRPHEDVYGDVAAVAQEYGLELII